jgi:hypothetical protein
MRLTLFVVLLRVRLYSIIFAPTYPRKTTPSPKKTLLTAIYRRLERETHAEQVRL